MLHTELSRCARHGYPLAFALFDVDHFKRVNDKYGHAAGDRVLSALGKLLGHHLRGPDLAARWGGEEFVVAFTSTDASGARTAAERLRAAIETVVVNDDAGERIPVTASIGVASWTPGEALESLVSRADHAMYASKTAGRNRVTVDETRAFVAPDRERRMTHAASSSTTRSPRGDAGMIAIQGDGFRGLGRARTGRAGPRDVVIRHDDRLRDPLGPPPHRPSAAHLLLTWRARTSHVDRCGEGPARGNG